MERVLTSKVSIFGRSTSLPVRHVSQGIQTQASPDGAQAFAQRREALPVPKVSQALLSFGFVQPAYESPLLLLSTLSG